MITSMQDCITSDDASLLELIKSVPFTF